ncbi:hypothetical protein PR048_008695, partial [Dryococelus australis]
MTNAINGFDKTGIWPPHPNVFFSTADYLPAATTGIQLDNKCTPGCSSWVSDGYSPRPSASAFQTASLESLIPILLIKQTVKRTKIKNGKLLINITEDRKTRENEEDAECLNCGDLYSTSYEVWLSCQSCLKRTHISCSGIDKDDDDALLLCEYCKWLQ